MGRTVLAAFLACVLTCTFSSIGHAQSAEEMAKGQSPGIRYIKPFSDDCERYKLVVDIRGDELTYGKIQDWATSECKLHNPSVPNYVFGTLWKYSTSRIVKKYMDGNKVVFETNGNDVARFIIDGYSATSCWKAGQNLRCSGGFTREQ